MKSNQSREAQKSLPYSQLFSLISKVRDFMNREEILETPTPPLVTHPGLEAHLHPFQIYSLNEKKLKNLYLHTSPEFILKNFLSLGYEKIYNISYCFRDEPYSSTHRPQFLMLEWYRTNVRYEKIQEDLISLVNFCSEESITIQTKTIQEIFQEILNLDIYSYQTKEKLGELITTHFKNIPLAHDWRNSLSWDDLYYLLFLNEIEPKLSEHGPLILKEYPASQAALSTLKESDSRVCERFEFYMNGIEIANCFNELTDLKIQKDRFNTEANIKKELYQYELGSPNLLFNALERGLPSSAGIALGLERLCMALFPKANAFFIDENFKF